jgi:hypothetical protein
MNGVMMTHEEVTRLLEGARCLKANLSDGRVVTLGRRELQDVEVFRRVWIEAGCNPPDYSPDEFDDVIRGMFIFADKCAEVVSAA